MIRGPEPGHLADERVLRAYDAELVALWVGKDGPGLGAGLPDVDPLRPEREKAVDLLIAVCGAAGEIEMQAVLNRLGLGDRHETHADRCVLIGPDDDLVLPFGQDLPAERLRPEPGQAGQIVSVNDDVVESDRHAASMRGSPDRVADVVTVLSNLPTKEHPAVKQKQAG